MLSLLSRGPLRVVRRRPGTRSTYEMQFRHPIPSVAGFTLHITEDSQHLELLDADGLVVGAAMLPGPRVVEDLT